MRALVAVVLVVPWFLIMCLGLRTLVRLALGELTDLGPRLVTGVLHLGQPSTRTATAKGGCGDESARLWWV